MSGSLIRGGYGIRGGLRGVERGGLGGSSLDKGWNGLRSGAFIGMGVGEF